MEAKEAQCTLTTLFLADCEMLTKRKSGYHILNDLLIKGKVKQKRSLSDEFLHKINITDLNQSIPVKT